MARLGGAAFVVWAVGAFCMGDAGAAEGCSAWTPEPDQLIALRTSQSDDKYFVRSLSVNGRLIANRQGFDNDRIFQVLGPVRNAGWVLFSPERQGYVEAGEDLFLFAGAELEEAAIFEFVGDKKNAVLLRFQGTRRYVEFGDEKNGLRFSARSRRDATSFCVARVELAD